MLSQLLLNHPNLAVHMCTDGILVFGTVMNWTIALFNVIHSVCVDELYTLLVIFKPMIWICCPQLKSGYSCTGSSGGLPGGQITLNIQKVNLQKMFPSAVIFVEYLFIEKTSYVRGYAGEKISNFSKFSCLILVWESECRVGTQSGVGK